MKLSPEQIKLVEQARNKITNLRRLQDRAYSELLADLGGIDDSAGWIFDYLFNDSDIESLENL